MLMGGTDASMAQPEPVPPKTTAADSPAAAFDEAYIKLRGTYVKALSGATSEEEQQILHGQVIRIIRFRALVNLEASGEVLDATAAVRADQETADTYIANQVAAQTVRADR